MTAQGSSSILGRLGAHLDIHLLCIQLSQQMSEYQTIKAVREIRWWQIQWSMLITALLHRPLFQCTFQSITVGASQDASKARSNYLAPYHNWRQRNLFI